MALEEIEGIKNGNNQHTRDRNNFQPSTQADLAEKLKVSQRQLNNYKKLLDLVPELQSAVEEGRISATNAENMRLLCFCLHPQKSTKKFVVIDRQW